MPSGHMLVTFGSIAQAESDVQSTANNLNQQLGDLKAYLQPLVSTWQGAASTDYQAKQAEWDKAQQELNQILAQISRALGHANESYQQVEHRNQSMWL